MAKRTRKDMNQMAKDDIEALLSRSEDRSMWKHSWSKIEDKKPKTYLEQLKADLASYERQARQCRQGAFFYGEHPAVAFERQASLIRREIVRIENPEAAAAWDAAMVGSRGGKKGGPARAKKLSAKRRSEIAKKAAQARWKSK
jgi:hypothetical protein